MFLSHRLQIEADSDESLVCIFLIIFAISWCQNQKVKFLEFRFSGIRIFTKSRILSFTR